MSITLLLILWQKVRKFHALSQRFSISFSDRLIEKYLLGMDCVTKKQSAKKALISKEVLSKTGYITEGMGGVKYG